MNPKIEIFSQNTTLFWPIWGFIFGHFGVEKVVFWTFSNLFWSCLVSVWALFSASNGLLLGVYWAPKVDQMRFWSNICSFWPIWWVIFGNLKSIEKTDFVYKNLNPFIQNPQSNPLTTELGRRWIIIWLTTSNYLIPITFALLWGPPAPY